MVKDSSLLCLASLCVTFIIKGLHGLRCVFQLQPSLPMPTAREEKWREEGPSPIKDGPPEAAVPFLCVPGIGDRFHGLNAQRDGLKHQLCCKFRAEQIFGCPFTTDGEDSGGGGRWPTLYSHACAPRPPDGHSRGPSAEIHISLSLLCSVL